MTPRAETPLDQDEFVDAPNSAIWEGAMRCDICGYIEVHANHAAARSAPEPGGEDWGGLAEIEEWAGWLFDNVPDYTPDGVATLKDICREIAKTAYRLRVSQPEPPDLTELRGHEEHLRAFISEHATGDDIGLVHDSLTLLIRGLSERAVSEGLLDAAWAEAETAIGEGVELFLTKDVLNPPESRYEVEASARTLTEGRTGADWTFSADFKAQFASGPTPAAALRALMERLTASREPA